MPLRSNLENQALDSFVRIWCEASVDGGIPRKPAVDPIVMGKAGILPIVWLLEQRDDGFYCRLAGEDIVRAIGKPVRGKAVPDVYNLDSAKMLSAQWERIVSTGETCHNRGLITGSDGYQHTGERVALPMADKDGAARFVIGATVYNRLQGIVENVERLAAIKTEMAEFTPIDEVFQSFGVSVTC